MHRRVGLSRVKLQSFLLLPEESRCFESSSEVSSVVKVHFPNGKQLPFAFDGCSSIALRSCSLESENHDFKPTLPINLALQMQSNASLCIMGYHSTVILFYSNRIDICDKLTEDSIFSITKDFYGKSGSSAIKGDNNCKEIEVKISCYELIDSGIRDLISRSNTDNNIQNNVGESEASHSSIELKIRDNPSENTLFVEGLQEVNCCSHEELMDIIISSLRKRTVSIIGRVAQPIASLSNKSKADHSSLKAEIVGNIGNCFIQLKISKSRQLTTIDGCRTIKHESILTIVSLASNDTLLETLDYKGHKSFTSSQSALSDTGFNWLGLEDQSSRANQIRNACKGLSTLSRVIAALVERNKSRTVASENSPDSGLHYGLSMELTHSEESFKKVHIPFRDSCLTRLLRHSLDGNCFLSMVTLPPSDPESASRAMRFASQISQLSNLIWIKEDLQFFRNHKQQEGAADQESVIKEKSSTDPPALLDSEQLLPQKSIDCSFESDELKKFNESNEHMMIGLNDLELELERLDQARLAMLQQLQFQLQPIKEYAYSKHFKVINAESKMENSENVFILEKDVFAVSDDQDIDKDENYHSRGTKTAIFCKKEGEMPVLSSFPSEILQSGDRSTIRSLSKLTPESQRLQMSRIKSSKDDVHLLAANSKLSQANPKSSSSSKLTTLRPTTVAKASSGEQLSTPGKYNTPPIVSSSSQEQPRKRYNKGRSVVSRGVSLPKLSPMVSASTMDNICKDQSVNSNAKSFKSQEDESESALKQTPSGRKSLRKASVETSDELRRANSSSANDSSVNPWADSDDLVSERLFDNREIIDEKVQSVENDRAANNPNDEALHRCEKSESMDRSYSSSVISTPPMRTSQRRIDSTFPSIPSSRSSTISISPSIDSGDKIRKLKTAEILVSREASKETSLTFPSINSSPGQPLDDRLIRRSAMEFEDGPGIGETDLIDERTCINEEESQASEDSFGSGININSSREDGEEVDNEGEETTSAAKRLERAKKRLKDGAEHNFSTVDSNDSDGLNDLERHFLRSVATGNLEKTQECIDEGVNVHVKNTFERDAMQIAARHGSVSMLELVRANGGSLKSKGINGDTLQHLAAHNGHVKVMKWLKGLGASLDVIDSQGQSLVHIAARRGELEVLKYLKDEIDIEMFNLEDNQGRSPIECIPRRGPPELQLCRDFLSSVVDLEGKNLNLIFAKIYGFA